MVDLPTGEVTFLFTDIEGSTRLLGRVGSERYAELLEKHHGLVRSGLAQHAGLELRTEGDAFFAVFQEAPTAIDAAVHIQRALREDQALAAEELFVRMGLHRGNAVLGGDNYTGLDLHIAARISGAAHGGQILVSDRLASASAAADASFKPLGEFWLKDIEQPVAMSQVLAVGLSSDFPPPRAASSHPTNAPVDLSSFIGRDNDVEMGVTALGDSRLVTLTGPGGTGKTRLAIEIGSKLSREFEDGAYFVALAGIGDPESVPNITLDAMAAPLPDTTRPPIEHLCDYLRHRSALIIMDNFEHVVAGAPYVARLLEASPQTRVLATSRLPLGIAGEREVAIAPLDVSDTALELFTERARSVRPTFELDASNRAAVEGIVKRLDGLPLAIELAAARVRMMSCEAILETLDPLSLTGRGSSEREVTLADTIRWSYDLLTEPEQKLLTRLGVFPTGAALEQINSVARPQDDLGLDLFAGLGSLVDHSLLVGQHEGPEPRFRMLETVREFAVRRLAEDPDEPEIRRRHAAAYLALLEDVRPHLDGVDSARWMVRLGTENASLRSAFAYATETRDGDTAQRMVAAAWRFWQARGHLGEGTIAAAQALELPSSDPIIRARALDAAGSIAYWTGDEAATRALYDEAVNLRDEHQLTDGLANALYNLSFPVSDMDGPQAATELLNRAVEVAEVDHDRRIKARSLIAMARTWLGDDPQRAVDLAHQAVVASQDLGDPVGLAWTQTLRAAALHHVQRHADSVTDLQVGLAVFDEHNDLSGVAVTLTGIAENARQLGDADTSVYLAGAVIALRDETGMGVSTVLDETITMYADPETVASLPPDLADSFNRGKAASLEQATRAAASYRPRA